MKNISNAQKSISVHSICSFVVVLMLLLACCLGFRSIQAFLRNIVLAKVHMIAGWEKLANMYPLDNCNHKIVALLFCDVLAWSSGHKD